MKLQVKNHISFNKGDSKGIVELLSMNGTSIKKYEMDFRGTNKIYACYKTLQRVIPLARKLGATQLHIESNNACFLNEISGQHNVNSTLLNQTLDRLYTMEVVSVKLND